MKKNKSLTTETQGHGVCISLCLRVSVVLFLLLPSALFSQSFTQSLSSNWQFSESGKNEWLPATVPGTVHTDLMANGKIPDPYIGMNEEKVQWVESKTWEYKTVFDCDKKLWKQKKKALYFEGLDTYADVYLNDSLLFTAEDMFIPYTCDVTKFLRKKKNVLRIVFHPAGELIEKNKAKEDYKNLPGGDRVFIRKAQYQFGWDWGPRLVTCGVWKNVRLEGWTGFALDDLSIRTEAIQNDTAMLELDFLFKESLAQQKQPLHITVSDNSGATYLNTSTASLKALGFGFAFSVPHPRLWWCNGMGKPEQYEFTVTLSLGRQKIVRKVRYAIRKIILDRHPDAAGFAHTFYLNDKPVFCKGANWIPCDNFLPRVTTEKYYSLLKTVQQSNMNMLRVWGGGAYEDDRFYDMCDSLGIMVWQDFMFAGGIYPSGLQFTGMMERECNWQFQRLQQHGSVVVWSGNNEITEGWMNWGWQKEMQIAAKDSVQLFSSYHSFFYERLQNLLHTLDRNAIYWPSSPETGWGHNEAFTGGDVHYWGVWWGMEPFSSYDSHVGRFVSEFGFQGMPDERTIAQFAPGCQSLTDPSLRVHQKHPKGFETIDTYLQRDYPATKNFGDYVYLSQVAQRDGISRAIEAHRRARPYCMGSLFWQYNDCWPVTSWSSNDYYGRPKLLQYALKDLYAPVILSITERNDSVLIYLVNDDTLEHDGLLGFQWMGLDGNIVRTSVSPSFVRAGSSRVAVAFSKKMLLDTLAPQKGMLHVAFNYDGGKTISANHYFVPVKDLALAKDPGLIFDVSPGKEADGYRTITLRTVQLAKSVYLSINDPNAIFSDNGFDLLPNEERVVRIKSDLSAEQLKQQLVVRTINGI